MGRAIAFLRKSDQRSWHCVIASRELEPVSSADLFRYGNTRYDTNSAQLAALIIVIASSEILARAIALDDFTIPCQHQKYF